MMAESIITLIVRIVHQYREDPLPNTRSTPARVALIHHSKVAKVCGQISAGNACAVALKHSSYEEPIVSWCRAHMAFASRQ